MDWKALSNYVLLVGLFVPMVTMFNGVNARIGALNERIERMQAETHARFDAQQVETNSRFDAVDARFDAVLEAIMSFDRRVSHLEGRLDAQGAE